MENKTDRIETLKHNLALLTVVEILRYVRSLNAVDMDAFGLVVRELENRITKGGK